MELAELVQDPIIRDYLKDYPSKEWKTILTKTLIYGIQSLKALQAIGLNTHRSEKIPALKIKLNDLKSPRAQLPEAQGPKSSTPNHSTSHSHIKRKHSETHSSRNHSQNIKQKPAKFSESKLHPVTKLIGREILTSRQLKLKPETLLGFKSSTFRVEEKVKSDKDEANSLSTFHPSEDMKKVFQQDFSRQAREKNVPKVLRPIEIKQEKRHHNFSSISAQVFCSSSEISD